MKMLRDKVNEFVAQSLDGYVPTEVRGHKVIHDTIWGSNLFCRHEVAVLDLPFLQRLRRISQVDFVPLVWPSANHNRFEHTLGVTVMADRLARAVRNCEPGCMTDSDAQHVRIRRAP